MPLPKIIGLIGKARSGKSTAANYLRDNYGYRVVSCADPLKRLVVEALTNNPPPAMQGPGVAPDYRTWGHTSERDWSDYIYHNRTPFTRWLLQFIGTDIGRALNPEVWVGKLEEILEESADSIVIPDVRFQNEVDAVKWYGGEIWRTVRLDDHAGVEHGAAHVSETELADYEADFTIEVPRGIEWIHRAIESYARQPIRSYRGDDGVNTRD